MQRISAPGIHNTAFRQLLPDIGRFGGAFVACGFACLLSGCMANAPEVNDALLAEDTTAALETVDSLNVPLQSDMISAVRGQIQNFKGDDQIDPSFNPKDAQLEWLPARLSTDAMPQGFVLAPVVVGGINTRYAVAIKQNGTQWEIADGPELYGNTFEVVDVDNDGVDELFTVREGEGQGVREVNYSLVNLERKRTRTLWETNGYDRTDMLPLLHTGDTLAKLYRVSFGTDDDAGNRVLLSTEQIQLFKGMTGDAAKLTSTQREYEYHYNGKQYRLVKAGTQSGGDPPSVRR